LYTNKTLINIRAKVHLDPLIRLNNYLSHSKSLFTYNKIDHFHDKPL